MKADMHDSAPHRDAGSHTTTLKMKHDVLQMNRRGFRSPKKSCCAMRNTPSIAAFFAREFIICGAIGSMDDKCLAEMIGRDIKFDLELSCYFLLTPEKLTPLFPTGSPTKWVLWILC